jgi:hypothetical protein
MPVVTTRAEFEKLVVLRMQESKLLIDQLNDCDWAYYLAGYAVEFAFTVRIISQLMKSDSFPDRKLAENFYKHDLSMLRKVAGLDVEMDADPAMAPHWIAVKDWSEQSRYGIGMTEQKARNFYHAIDNGVLPWIKARW